MQMERRILEVDGCHLAFYETGSGDTTILFLHGNSESAAIFTNQFHSGLGDSFKLVALDLPGHGNSARAKNDEHVYNLPYLRNLVGKIIETIESPLVLAGSSFGGHIALELAHLYPDSIRGLFLDGTPPLSSAADFGEAFIPSQALGSWFKECISDEELHELTAECINDTARYDFFKQIILQSDGRFRTCIFESLIKNEMLDEKMLARTATIPIAVLHGAFDKVVNLDYYKTVSYSTLWRNQIQLVPGAAHLPSLENGELYNNLLTEFVNEVCPKYLK